MHLIKNIDQRYIDLEFSSSNQLEPSSDQSNTFLTYSKQSHRLHVSEVCLDFALMNRVGKEVNLKDCVSAYPTVLLIHDEQPLNEQDKQLQAWENALPIFSKLGIAVIEVVSSLQGSLFTSITDTSHQLDVLLDTHRHVIQSFMLMNAPTITQCSSYQNPNDQLVCLPPNSSTQSFREITCIISGNQAFVRPYKTSDHSYAIDLMYHIMLIDPDYWLALV